MNEARLQNRAIKFARLRVWIVRIWLWTMIIGLAFFFGCLFTIAADLISKSFTKANLLPMFAVDSDPSSPLLTQRAPIKSRKVIFQPLKSGFPEEQIDQPFDGWVQTQLNFISPLKRASQKATAKKVLTKVQPKIDTSYANKIL